MNCLLAGGDTDKGTTMVAGLTKPEYNSYCILKGLCLFNEYMT